MAAPAFLRRLDHGTKRERTVRKSDRENEPSRSFRAMGWTAVPRHDPSIHLLVYCFHCFELRLGQSIPRNRWGISGNALVPGPNLCRYSYTYPPKHGLRANGHNYSHILGLGHGPFIIHHRWRPQSADVVPAIAVIFTYGQEVAGSSPCFPHPAPTPRSNAS